MKKKIASEEPMFTKSKIKDPISYMKAAKRKNKKKYTTFLKGLQRRKLRGLDALAIALHKKAFKAVDCLACANCCKTMSPTYKKADVKRISKHLGMSFSQYYEKYLYKDKSGDYMNTQGPCQFLRKDNKCSIYPVRPKDCSGFPHTQNRDFKLYIAGTHIQNMEYCPATMYIVENMFDLVMNKKNVNLNAAMAK
ncbi:MAG: YkgJ family cysteine cluster protein [Bacteroidetes bacterium]|nr:YkgJ family cysteine cluster protein [Bacteroidota bacterium]